VGIRIQIINRTNLAKPNNVHNSKGITMLETLTTQELQNLFMHLIETPTPACIATAEMVMALINDRLLQPA
jgi:hypothetical protein